MRNSDFPSIVSPVGAGALGKGRRKAKGGGISAKPSKAPHQLLIILMPHPEVTGALGRSAGMKPMGMGKRK